MKLTGKSLIAGEWIGNSAKGFNAINPTLNTRLPETFSNAPSELIDQAINQANKAFAVYNDIDVIQRAKFLRCIGANIMLLGEELISTVHKETGLPDDRIKTERERTVFQLNLYAEKIEKEEYKPVCDVAEPNRKPTPKPDLRLGYIPLGVVAVFGASNFPLAYSTAGGDTATALAAGCTVVMKAHSSHPATSELVANAILNAINECELPLGIFSLIQGEDHNISSQIVKHPLVKAVGFTGSERVGMILQRQVYEREEPIPFYGELGSVNPQFILPNKLSENPQALAELFVSSFTLSQGQFCTSPGLWIVFNNEDQPQKYHHFIKELATLVNKTSAGVMLTPGIADAFHTSVNHFKQLKGVKCIAEGEQGSSQHLCSPVLFETNVDVFLSKKELQVEVFGSCAVIIKCSNIQDVNNIIKQLKGSLTASIHASNTDVEYVTGLVKKLVYKVGRLIYNQMSTGVEVCGAMNHGGPFPASTNIQSTSVGTEAIKRFQRPICYQNIPDDFLPTLLKKC